MVLECGTCPVKKLLKTKFKPQHIHVHCFTFVLDILFYFANKITPLSFIRAQNFDGNFFEKFNSLDQAEKQTEIQKSQVRRSANL